MEDEQLTLLLAFLNSHDLNDVDDWLVPEHFADWVHSAAPDGLLDADDNSAGPLHDRLSALAGDAVLTSAGEIARARDVRDGLIAVLLDEDPGTAAGSLDAIARDIPFRVRVSAPGVITLEPAERGALAIAGAALVAAHDAVVDGTWPRIRLCSADDCHWAFVDRSRNGSRRWCSMDDCGARAKARAYRERQRAGG